MKTPMFNTEEERKAIEEVKKLLESNPQVSLKQLASVLSKYKLQDVQKNWIEEIVSQAFEAVEQIKTSTRSRLDGEAPPVPIMIDEKVMAAAANLALVTQFTTPTSLLPVIPTFGRGGLPEGDVRDAGRLEVRRWIYLPDESSDQERQVQLELPFKNKEAGIEPLERQLRSISDPLGLKVILGALFFCDKNYRKGWFTYDANNFCDLLGYSRTKSGYHQRPNKERIESRIKTFLRALYRCEWTGGFKGRIPLEASLLLLDPNSSVAWIVENVELCKGQIIYFCGPLYGDIVIHNMYSWVDSRFLQLDADKHGRVIQLGTYYSTAWRIDWKNSKGKLHRKLRTILSDSGIPIGVDQRNLQRTIKAIKKDHDFMVKEGFIKDCRIIQHAGNPLNEIWEIVIPDTHGLVIAQSVKV